MAQTRSGSAARVTPARGPSAGAGGRVLSHTPTTGTLVWLAASLPAVLWDAGYILLRPHSMPGGKLHSPLWVPYELYGRVDHIYGFKQWNLNNGFTAAQGTLNLVETAFYLYYVYIWATSAVKPAVAGQRAALTGKPAAHALLVLFTGLVMTLSKTVLYWLNESWSGFDNIGHNTLQHLIFLWIIPNGLWIIMPGYFVYSIGSEIMEGLAPSAGSASSLKAE